MKVEVALRRYATLKPEPACLALLCLYEFVSITTRRTPTVTNLTMRLPREARAVVVAAAAVWLTRHMEVL